MTITFSFLLLLLSGDTSLSFFFFLFFFLLFYRALLCFFFFFFCYSVVCVYIIVSFSYIPYLFFFPSPLLLFLSTRCQIRSSGLVIYIKESIHRPRRKMKITRELRFSISFLPEI